jgi:hypothetical protein
MDILLLLFFAAVLGAIIYGVWLYWDGLVDRSEDEEEYDRRVADLNQRQANRFSDEQLTRPPSADDAWQIIQQRGRRLNRHRPPRYGGDLARRERERRKRERP